MADLDKELRESLAYFEQILNVLPGDRTALEFLCVACLQLGDSEKFLSYAKTLADVLVRDHDAVGAADLLKKLEGSSDPRLRATKLRLQVVVGPQPKLQFEVPEQQLTAASPEMAIRSERALLERLGADGVLSKSQVELVRDQLETLPSEGDVFLVSALAILEKENPTGVADAVAAVADAAHAPPVPLEAFDIRPAWVRKLPAPLVKGRGVVPFAQLGDEWAVVTLNPLDDALRQAVKEGLGAKCHFFLALPSAVEAALERVFKAEGESAETAGRGGVAEAPVEQHGAAQPVMPVSSEPPPIPNGGMPS